ncbi:MAG: DUF2029 domain-containing protein [Candidatus Omnitrophica bacterium]|nr:DUF2029 domain-containing protein [Candidatus Omnitrophota bacterium]
MFTRAAEEIAQKKEIYQTSYLETGRDYYKYSPAFAVAMIPLSKLHKHLAVPLWYLSIFIFFTSSIYFTKKILVADKDEKILSKAFYSFGILLSLRFLLSILQRVQSDGLVLFLLSLFIFALFYKKQALAGIALATAVMVKLTPLIFLPYLIFRKKFKALLACVAALLFYAWSPSLLVGSAKNLEYLKNWLLVHKTNPADYLLWYKNQSLFSCLSRFFTQGSPVSLLNLNQTLVFIIFITLAAALCCLIFVLCRKLPITNNGPAYLTEISLVLVCMILFSPLAWKHTFIHLLIPHLVLLYYVLYLNPGDRAARLLLIGSFVLNTVLNPELTKPIAETVQLYSSVTFGTLFLFAALLRVRYKLCKR